MLLNNFFLKFIYLLLPLYLRKTVCSNRTWSSQHFSYWVSPSYAFENNDNWGISNLFCNIQFSLYIQFSFTLSYYVLILWKLETTEAPCSKWKWSRSVVSDSSRPHGLRPTRLLCPWDFPGKSAGVGCHCLLHVVKLLLNRIVDLVDLSVFLLLLFPCCLNSNNNSEYDGWLVWNS